MAKKKKDSLIVHEGEAFEDLFDEIYESTGPKGKKIFDVICIGFFFFCLFRTIKFLIMLFTGGSE